MKVYESTLKVFLLKNIPSEQALEKISEIIDQSLSRTEDLLSFHQVNQYKYYTFNNLFPLEGDRIYREGKIYSIKIRTIKEDLSKHFMKNLANEYTSWMKALTITQKIIPQRHIQKLYTITPLIIKTEQGYWKDHLSLEQFENRIKENLIKKYNLYFNTKLDENFQLYHMIKFDNHKPISSTYKNISLLGDKITLTIAENENAQKLAQLALGTGAGEMNPRGYGYMNYQWL